MSTAEMNQPLELAQNMKRVIKTLIANRETTAVATRDAMPMNVSTWRRRMLSGDWTAPELVRLAEVLDCGIGAAPTAATAATTHPVLRRDEAPPTP